ncbi:MAG: hypothetical protein EOP86_02110 [Verrucomicrobiaceae bacterium]|nr:MAG: hypothetical protein EOP86_02110 [Verrucomicrobiaceae bacterium]
MSFPTTRWTRLAEATLNGGTEARAALDAMCRKYWQPVYLSLRGMGISEEQGRDLTQGFFLHTMQHSLFRKADPLRGKFRSFLMGSLRRYLASGEIRKEKRLRNRGIEMVALEDTGWDLIAEDGPDQRIFDREWALTTMEAAMVRVRVEYETNRGRKEYEVLKGFLPNAGSPVPDYADAAMALGTTPGALRTDVSRLRKTFRDMLRLEVARTVSAPHEIEEELRHLKQVLIHG